MVIYRQHKKAKNLLEYLSSSLEEYSSRNRNIYLMGDFNIDLLKSESCPYSNEFLQIIQSLALLPIIEKPTRVYGKSATLIDNIFSNNPENCNLSGNIVTDTTDQRRTSHASRDALRVKLIYQQQLKRIRSVLMTVFDRLVEAHQGLQRLVSLSVLNLCCVFALLSLFVILTMSFCKPLRS